MKKLFVLISAFLFFSCKKDNEIESKLSAISVDFTIERFDKVFYESKVEDLPQIKSKYPFLFPEEYSDEVWESKLNDSLLKELYNEVQLKYKEGKDLKKGLEDLFKRIQFYFPEFKTPRVITVISEVDREVKAVYQGELVLISLDCYLGKEHRFYVDFPEYQKISFEGNQMLPDLVVNFSEKVISYGTNRSFLSSMIYYGKQLYLKDALLSKTNDAVKIGYTEQQLQWCVENEYQIWSYFVQNNLLFEADIKNELRFINDAPFSKFYLEIDKESPGRVGQWIGWQIVRSYMKNNQVSLRDMLKMDAKTIFEKSRYKPQN